MRRAVQDSNAADLLIDLPGAYQAVRVALMPAESSCLTQPVGLVADQVLSTLHRT
jgi:hypothetical protein